MALYEYLQEIKATTGWSQERISAETGLGLSTINRILRVPGYEPSGTTATLIRRLHEELVQQPFPAYLENLIYLIDFNKEQSTRRDYEIFLEIIENLLSGHSVLVEAMTPAACRMAWIIGHIYFNRAFYLKIEPEENAATAQSWYEKALVILETLGDENLNVHRFKLQQCITAVKFNRLPSGERERNSEFRAWLKEMKYIEVAAGVVKEAPWYWQAARNGLLAASALQDTAACALFWDALKRSNKHFTDLNYAPDKEISSLAEDPDLTWFRCTFDL